MNVAFREPNKSTPALDAIAEALLLPSGIIATISAWPGTCAPPPAKQRTPAASPSASTGWRWRCSRHTASICRVGRQRSARR